MHVSHKLIGVHDKQRQKAKSRRGVEDRCKECLRRNALLQPSDELFSLDLLAIRIPRCLGGLLTFLLLHLDEPFLEFIRTNDDCEGDLLLLNRLELLL